MKYKLYVLTFLFLLIPSIVIALPAFPGAEGMGASSEGARGAATQYVCKVINLTDSNPGTGVDTDASDYIISGNLRYCLEDSGYVSGSFVVFTVSGIINLDADIDVTSDYITIAGETSPGGIALEGGGLYFGTVSTSVNDIIIRHMRVRPGSDNYDGDGGNESQEAFGVRQGSFDIIVDHCSFSWAGDETVTVTTYVDGSTQNPVNNVTISWSIVSEGLDDAPGGETSHAYGSLFNLSDDTTQSTVTVHHSLYAHHRGRLPRVDGRAFLDWRNNIVYSWLEMFNSSYLSPGQQVFVNHVGSYAKPGPESDACYPTYRSGDAQVRDDGEADFCDDNDEYAMLYMSGNFGCVAEGSKGTGGWGAVCGNTGGSGLASENWRSATAFSTSDIAVTTSTMDANYFTTVLSEVGAIKPVRDSVDARIVSEVTNGNSSSLADADGYVGDVNWTDDSSEWGTFSTSGDNPTDTDSDGIPNSYEDLLGFDKNDGTDFDNDKDGDGYLNIEEYFHYLTGYVDESPPVIKTPIIIFFDE